MSRLGRRLAGVVSLPMAGAGLCALSLSAVGAPQVSSASASASPAPLEIAGKHVFWALGAPGISSATANNLIYHGGAVETSQKVFITYWGTEWSDPTNAAYTIPVKSATGTNYTLGGVESYVDSFFSGIGGTSYNNIQTQYCQGGMLGDLTCPAGTTRVTNSAGVLRGTWLDNNPADEPPTVIDTLGLAENLVLDPVATEAKMAAQHFASLGLYTPGDLNATFFVFSPPGRYVTGGEPYGAYCAYHSEITNVGGHGLRYAFIPYLLDTDLNSVDQAAGFSCGMNFVNTPGSKLYGDSVGNGVFDGFSIVSGHEYAEAVTDPDAWPFQDGWNDIQTNENGDKCAWIAPGSGQGAAQNLSFSTGTFAVQSLWSNAFGGGQGGCVVAYP